MFFWPYSVVLSSSPSTCAPLNKVNDLCSTLIAIFSLCLFADASLNRLCFAVHIVWKHCIVYTLLCGRLALLGSPTETSFGCSTGYSPALAVGWKKSCVCVCMQKAFSTDHSLSSAPIHLFCRGVCSLEMVGPKIR